MRNGSSKWLNGLIESNQSIFDNNLIQKQFYNCLSKAHHNYANLDILSNFFLKYIQTENPTTELDITQEDIKKYLIKVL